VGGPPATDRLRAVSPGARGAVAGSVERSAAPLRPKRLRADGSLVASLKSSPVGVRWALACLGGVIALYAVSLAGVGPELFRKVATNVVFLGSAALCTVRAISNREERVVWSLFAAGLWAWGLGDLYYAIFLWDLENVPFPSPADAGYLLFYPPVYVGLTLLYRRRVRGSDVNLWVDGLIAALAVAAIGAAVVFEAVQTTTDGPTATVATNLAYPLADMLVLGLVIWVVAGTGWRFGNVWAWIAGGLAVFAVADGLYLYETANGTYGSRELFDIGWPLGGLMTAVAAWLPDTRAAFAVRGNGRAIALPLLLAVVALGVLVYDHFDPTNVLAVLLASASLLAVLVRLALAFRENAEVIEKTRIESLTDPLTGLGNRRRLVDDLTRELLVQRVTRSLALLIFDLTGLKDLNDRYGHPAGDAALSWLGGNLAAAVERHGGAAYRLGGDEFCILCDVSDDELTEVVADCSRALSGESHGHRISNACGWALIPQEVNTLQRALRLADRRMYLRKRAGRSYRHFGGEAGAGLDGETLERAQRQAARPDCLSPASRPTARRSSERF
jgi:two-component system, cell cycle response regulator